MATQGGGGAAVELGGLASKKKKLEDECRTARPKRTGQAQTDCTQARLATLHMYTDDPLVIVVGVRRAMRLLEAWHRVTDEINLAMAGADKRQLGGHVEWIGVTVLAALGLIVIQKQKLARARNAIRSTIERRISFGEYRALIGLLEHLRFIACLQPDGESREWLNATVMPDKMMRKKLQAWLKVLGECAGALCTIIFAPDAHSKFRSARLLFSVSSDAAGDGEGATLSANADAALTPYALAHQRSKSKDVRVMLHLLLQLPEYQQAAERLVVEHLSGEGKVGADLLIRGLWERFHAFVEVMRVKPIRLPLTALERDFVTQVLEEAASHKGTLLDARVLSLDSGRERSLNLQEQGLGRKRRDREEGDGPFSLPFTTPDETLTLGIAQAQADGRNPRTLAKDNLAWRHFQEYAERLGFDPHLCTAWTKKFPERETVKLAEVLGAQALRRHFDDVELPPATAVKSAVKGLIRRFIRKFGIEQLRPHKAEPVTTHIVEMLVRQARKAGAWNLQEWECFITTAWEVVNLYFGSRKGESTRIVRDVDHNDWLTRACLSWRVQGAVVLDPTRAQLLKLALGDVARLAPKGAKCDQRGKCHGTEPVILPYADDDLSGARWLRDIELRWPAHNRDKESLPLFCDKRASDAQMIQAFGRWLNPESIKVYARLSVDEYSRWMDKIKVIRSIDAARTTTLPIIDAETAISRPPSQRNTNSPRLEWALSATNSQPPSLDMKCTTKYLEIEVISRDTTGSGATAEAADIKRNPVGKRLIVPLCFFFTKHPSSCFPVNAIAGLIYISTGTCKLRCHYIHVTGSEAARMADAEHVRMIKSWRNHNATVTIPHKLISATESPKIKRRLFDMELPFCSRF
ncbi:MAG: hypothetical protein SGPRY_009082 [Prymnesium sp.]